MKFVGTILILLLLALNLNAKTLKCVVATETKSTTLTYNAGEEYMQEGTLEGFAISVMHNTQSKTYDVQVSDEAEFYLSSTVPLLPDAQLEFKKEKETIRIQCK